MNAYFVSMIYRLSYIFSFLLEVIWDGAVLDFERSDVSQYRAFSLFLLSKIHDTV